MSDRDIIWMLYVGFLVYRFGPNWRMVVGFFLPSSDGFTTASYFKQLYIGIYFMIYQLIFSTMIFALIAGSITMLGNALGIFDVKI